VYILVQYEALSIPEMLQQLLHWCQLNVQGRTVCPVNLSTYIGPELETQKTPQQRQFEEKGEQRKSLDSPELGLRGNTVLLLYLLDRIKSLSLTSSMRRSNKSLEDMSSVLYLEIDPRGGENEFIRDQL